MLCSRCGKHVLSARPFSAALHRASSIADSHRSTPTTACAPFAILIPIVPVPQQTSRITEAFPYRLVSIRILSHGLVQHFCGKRIYLENAAGLISKGLIFEMFDDSWKPTEASSPHPWAPKETKIGEDRTRSPFAPELYSPTRHSGRAPAHPPSWRIDTLGIMADRDHKPSTLLRPFSREPLHTPRCSFVS